MALFVLAGTVIAPAADMPVRRFVREQAAGQCTRGVSHIAALQSLNDMMAAAEARYDDSDRESQSPATIDNRSPRYVWAQAARTACGIAIGHLSSGEVDTQRLWNCECYHARMQSAGRSDR